MNDFVLLHFASARIKTAVEYVGQVLEEFPERDEFKVKYLSQYMNRRNEFSFPQVVQEEIIPDDAIISVLARPTERRGKFTFPYDVI